jgi:hypothetical protein
MLDVARAKQLETASKKCVARLVGRMEKFLRTIKHQWALCCQTIHGLKKPGVGHMSGSISGEIRES